RLLLTSRFFPTRRSSDLGCAERVRRVDLISVPAAPMRFLDGDNRRHALGTKMVATASPGSKLRRNLGFLACSSKTQKVGDAPTRSEEHTSELQSRVDLVC